MPVAPSAVSSTGSSAVSPVVSGAGSYFVQVGAFSDVDNAHRVQAAVMSVGQAAVDVRRNRAGAELFRVRVGPFASREAAETARRSVAALGYAESVVVAP
jgi:cell division septation protein DedD